MKVISVPLADSTYARARERANSTGVDATAYCSSLLSDHFDTPTQAPPLRRPQNPPAQTVITPQPSSGDFDVRSSFRGFPEQSIRFAERFLDEVRRVDATVRIRKHKDSTVDIRDNFVRIEALLRRKHGIRVSFYGTPDQFTNAPSVLGPGMGS